MTGEVGYFTLPADDEARARKFYAAIFGWKMVEMPGGGFTMVSTGEVDQRGMPSKPGYVSGGIGKRGYEGVLQHTMVMITVDDISKVEAAIETSGGKILQPKRPIGDGSMGWTAYFRDPEGNVVGLYQNPAH